MCKRKNAIEISQYFICKGVSEENCITNKKLQKLLYYAQAWYLVFKDKPLFNDKIEAWIHGPAIPKVYQKYKEYGWGPITVSSKCEKCIFDNFSKDEIDHLDLIWNSYGFRDANYLECLTHSEKPWNDARKDISVLDPSRNVITHKSMKEYYSKIWNDVKEK